MESKGKFVGKVVGVNLEGDSGEARVTFQMLRKDAAELLKMPSGVWSTFQWEPYEAKKDKAA